MPESQLYGVVAKLLQERIDALVRNRNRVLPLQVSTNQLIKILTASDDRKLIGYLSIFKIANCLYSFFSFFFFTLYFQRTKNIRNTRK